MVGGTRTRHEAGSAEAGGPGETAMGTLKVLPKRHERFLERFRAAQDSSGPVWSAGGGDPQGGGGEGVTSFGALLPDVIGRAD